MIHTHDGHGLQPLIDQVNREKASFRKPKQDTLLELARALVSGQTSLYSYNPLYTREEQEQAIAILREFGLGHLCNLSQRYKAKTLAAIEAAKKELA